MSTKNIVRDFRGAADRFRRISSTDDRAAQTQLVAASASAAQCLKRASDAGQVTFPENWEFNWPAHPTRISEDNSSKWAARWDTTVLALQMSYPDELPPNPLVLKTIGSGDAKSSDRAAWRARAENFAIACDWLADRIEGGKDTRVETGNAVHSLDFASVYWFGQSYVFTPNQAACVKLMWAAWENKTPAMRDGTILEESETNSDLRIVFREHPAWGTMIVEYGKGTHGLATK